jgi:putative DNA primase/helicase
LLVDPVVSAVAGDDNKNSGVRRSLQPLVDLAAKIDLAVLGISHLSKGGAGNDPTSRVVGSIAYSAVARVVMVAAKMPNSPNGNSKVLVRSKSNIGPDNGGFEYSTEQIEIQDGIQASYVKWGGAIEGNARDLLAEADETGEKPGEISDIMELLKVELVSDNWTPAQDVTKKIEKMGFTNKQVWNASKKLDVIRKKVDMMGGWYWRLPPGTGQSEADKSA